MYESGIYSITNKINNNIYVGITNDIHIRWKHHKNNLLKGYKNRFSENYKLNKPRVRHHQIYLQDEFNQFYDIYKDKIWDDVYEFDLFLPITNFNIKELKKLEDSIILKLREDGKNYNQQTNYELGKKYKFVENENNIQIISNADSNKDNIIYDYIISKMSYRELAEKYNCGKTAIKGVLNRNNVIIRNPSESKIGFNLEDYKNNIINMYLNENKNATQIGKIYKVSGATINTFLKKNDIELKNYQILIAGIDLNDYKPDIIYMYEVKNMSALKIAKHYNVSKTTILRYLKNWNVKMKLNHSDYKCKTR